MSFCHIGKFDNGPRQRQEPTFYPKNPLENSKSQVLIGFSITNVPLVFNSLAESPKICGRQLSPLSEFLEFRSHQTWFHVKMSQHMREHQILRGSANKPVST